MRANEFITEDINPDIRNPEFEHEQQIGDYLYTAKTRLSDSGFFTYLLIRCYDGDKLIGRANFEVRILAGKKWLESQNTQVEGGYTNKGIASTMYAYAKMLGNTIKPSKYQSDDGKAMWKAWKKSGDARHLTAEENTEHSQPKAAGCIIVAEDTGRWCLQQRSDTVSDPGVWSTWGGGVEPGETLEQTVRRELAEEGGYQGPARLKHVHTSPQYATYIAFVPNEFEPEINYESKDWCWVDPDQLPTPLHPGLIEALTVEPVDVEAIHAQALNEHLLSNPGLYENRDDVKRTQDFLNQYKTNRPKIGTNYIYTSVQVTPLMNFITVARFNEAQKLVALDNKRAYFAVNGTVRTFPESGSLSGDSLSQIYFFESTQQLEKFLMLLNLKFSDYKQSTKILDQSFYENFNDGKNPGRKGLSRRVGIPKKPSLGQLEKIAKSSTGEKRRMAQWQLNMRRGKAKKE